MTTDISPPPTRAGAREWIGLAVLILPTLLVAIDVNVLFLALPRLSADLGADGVEQLWISDVYGFMVAGLTITAGTLGDRWGRRRLLFAGAAGFLLASLLAAFATGPAMLIASRALLGVAGATLMPSTLALISTMFTDARQRGKAVSLWATCQFAGAALGPVFGGLLLEHFWWGSVFLPAVPVMLVLLVFGPFVLPEFRSPTPRPMDLPSVALSLGAILPLVYGIKNLAVGEAATVPTLALAVGGALGVWFVRRQSRLDDPLMDLALLRRPAIAVVLSSLLLGGILLAGVGLLVTQYLQSVLGYSPIAAASLFTPMGLAMATGTLLAPRLARRAGRTRLVSGGMLLSGAGAAVLAVDTGLPGVLVGISVLALGFGPLFALGTDLVIGSVPPEHAGAAASLAESSNHTGGNLGIALLGTVAAVVYRIGLPPGADGAVRETIAGANAALPEGGALLQAAREAFTNGLHVVAVIAAALCLLVAAMTSRLPRD
ncbi:MFS transporter [Glycomyces albidus]|uniref:MFS transporter n=1 Tax=Glycomyces albidus TaxID=2656774 RepID=A0A6L5G794_9ACTN|nr:MFS transporter [Glycomyces albidus]MQM25524.1 MFS transporter [Glycomyces albidus]